MSQLVSDFLDEQKHPRRKEIDLLRQLIHDANALLVENIKWNGPNFTFEGTDCITLRIQPPTKVQIIFHRGAKVKAQPSERMVSANHKWLVFKENDRAVASFKSFDDIIENQENFKKLVYDWLFGLKNLAS